MVRNGTRPTPRYTATHSNRKPNRIISPTGTALGFSIASVKTSTLSESLRWPNQRTTPSLSRLSLRTVESSISENAMLNHNQKEGHRNGIHRPLRCRYPSLKGVDPIRRYASCPTIPNDLDTTDNEADHEHVVHTETKNSPSTGPEGTCCAEHRKEA
ncbi:hypothetical protein H4Q26_009449 [Puccinia striiformis f. sp. tritici PST-130]|nr:hypothetical protein H4Q26_009449 [Puccinia striiformis f. sp. tritici PST-130]